VELVESFVLVHLSSARSTSDDGNGAGPDPILSSGEFLLCARPWMLVRHTELAGVSGPRLSVCIGSACIKMSWRERELLLSRATSLAMFDILRLS